MQYRFRHLEYNSLKGAIGEKLAKSFVRNILAPRLIDEEDWHHIVLSGNDYKQHSWTWNAKLFNFDVFREDFIKHGFFACMKLLSKYSKAASILEKNRCTPDGILLKLKETGKTRRLKANTVSSIARLGIDACLRDGNVLNLPIVEGDLETVEIKCGRNAKLMERQQETYNNLIAEGVPLRIIKVRIVSFDLNEFLVEEHRHEKFL